jgi:hypothetical protein
MSPRRRKGEPLSVPVNWHPLAKEDFRNLPSAKVQLEAAKYIRIIGRVPTFGLPLEFRRDTGDLSDCFKIYINDRKHRIVYRPVPTAKRPKSVDVILIGERNFSEAYIEAVKRLGRPSGQPVF